MSSSKLLSFLTDKYGTPDYLFEYILKTHENKKVELFVMLPLPDEGIMETTFITIGFSSIFSHLEEMSAECFIELVTSLDGLALERFGHEIVVNLIHIFDRADPALVNEVFSPVEFSLFPDVEGLIALNFGKEESYFWASTPPVRVLEFFPLQGEEINSVLVQPTEIRNTIIMRARNVEWSKWNRPAKDIIASAVFHTWQFIEKWYEEKLPKLLEDLNPGVKQEDILMLEKFVGQSLPEDFAASLKTHNGLVYVHDYEYLSVEYIKDTWQMMKELTDSKTFENLEDRVMDSSLIKKVWWDINWIPFARDGGGNLICLDLAPGKDGIKGQVIYWERTEGPIPTNLKSFFHWLSDYQFGLYRKRYSDLL